MNGGKLIIMLYCSSIVLVLAILGVMSVPNKVFAGFCLVVAFTGLAMMAIADIEQR